MSQHVSDSLVKIENMTDDQLSKTDVKSEFLALSSMIQSMQEILDAHTNTNNDKMDNVPELETIKSIEIYAMMDEIENDTKENEKKHQSTVMRIYNNHKNQFTYKHKK